MKVSAKMKDTNKIYYFSQKHEFSGGTQWFVYDDINHHNLVGGYKIDLNGNHYDEWRVAVNVNNAED